MYVSIFIFVSMSVHPSVNNVFFSISSLITWPTKLKLRRMIPDIGAHGAGEGAQNFNFFTDVCTCFLVSPS